MDRNRPTRLALGLQVVALFAVVVAGVFTADFLWCFLTAGFAVLDAGACAAGAVVAALGA